MDRLYQMLCVDCGEVLSLGKVARRNEHGQTVPWYFGGFGDYNQSSATWTWIGAGELWLLVERFMLLHRGHELRVLPSVLVETIDPEGRLAHIIDNLAEFRERPINPAPDEEVNEFLLSHEVIGRLTRRIAQLPQYATSEEPEQSEQ
jgi:hypothetical protein